MQILQQIPRLSANIIISPPLEGKRLFIYALIAQKLKEKEPILYITTDTSPELIKKELLTHKIFFGDKLLRFIDCYSHHVGEHKADTAEIKRVSGPLSLNEISIAMSNFEREIVKERKYHSIIFDSISTMLMYSNPQAIGRFIQVLIAKSKKAGGSIFFTLEQGMHKEDVMVTMEHLMDIIIHVKRDGTKLLTKLVSKDRIIDWTEFKISF